MDLSPPDFGSGIKTRTLDEMNAVTWSLVTGLGSTSQLVVFLNHLSSTVNKIEAFNDVLYEESTSVIDPKVQKLIDNVILGKHPNVHIAVDY